MVVSAWIAALLLAGMTPMPSEPPAQPKPGPVAALPIAGAGASDSAAVRVEYGVYDFPMTLGKALEPERSALRVVVRDAQRRVVRFAALHGWTGLVQQAFAKEVRIFDAKPDFDRTLITISGAPQTTILPKTYSAALEQDVLFSVSPGLYLANYSDGASDPAAFEKLLAHEISHRLHVRILDGLEDDMGPIWFFEGFALYAAGQFLEAPLPTPEEVAKVVSSHGRGSYREYARVFRYLARRVPLPELIERGRKPGLAEWVKLLEAK